MNAIFDKDDDCCDQEWSYYAHDPRFKLRERAMGLVGYDYLEDCRFCRGTNYDATFAYIDSNT